jgi:hypothetical protein
LRFDPFPVLHWLVHLIEKLSSCDLAAKRTIFDLSPMFGHFNRCGGNIKYLPFFIPSGLNTFQAGLAIADSGAWFSRKFRALG